MFTIAPESGQFIVNLDFFTNLSVTLNFESAVRGYTLVLTGARYGFDSGWSPMRSQAVAPGTLFCSVVQCHMPLSPGRGSFFFFL